MSLFTWLIVLELAKTNWLDGLFWLLLTNDRSCSLDQILNYFQLLLSWQRYATKSTVRKLCRAYHLHSGISPRPVWPVCKLVCFVEFIKFTGLWRFFFFFSPVITSNENIRYASNGMRFIARSGNVYEALWRGSLDPLSQIIQHSWVNNLCGEEKFAEPLFAQEINGFSIKIVQEIYFLPSAG